MSLVWFAVIIAVIYIIVTTAYVVSGAGNKPVSSDPARAYMSIHGCKTCGKEIPPYAYTDKCGDCR